MGGFAHSIFNPINDISNVFTGTVHLFTNPGQQWAKYIRPAVEEAAPAAAAAGMTILSAGSLAPEAAALALGSYGSQAMTQGIGGLTSGKVMSTQNALTGVAAAAGMYGLQALGAGSLTAGITGPGGNILSGAGAAFGNVGAGIGAIGSGVSSGFGALGSGVKVAGSLLGLGTAGLGAYSAYENVTRQPGQPYASSQQTSQQSTSGMTSSQLSQLFQQIMGLSPSQLVAITDWQQLLPLFPQQEQFQIGGLFTPQMVAVLMEELQQGTIQPADFNAIMSVIPQTVQEQGQSIYEQATGQAAPGLTSTSGMQQVTPVSYTTATSSPQVNNMLSSLEKVPLIDYALIGGGVILSIVMIKKLINQ